MIGALFAISVAATPSAALPSPAARAQLQDARTIVYREGPKLWRGFRATPFRVDLIGANQEWLFCDPGKAPGFADPIRDPVTRCQVQTRARTLPDGLQAAFEIEGVGPAIAINVHDTADVARTAAWRLTVLHESFHLYQATIPGYDTATQAMRRSLGAQNDNWPLDYSFPYADPAIVASFNEMGRAALAFFHAQTPAASRAAIAAYVDARHRAASTAGERNWRYYEFQVGQEGVARWTEIRLGGSSREPALAALAQDRRLGWATSLTAIAQQGLGTWKRSAFYVYGAIEAAMLERWRPGWRDAYRQAPFALGVELDATVNSSPARSPPAAREDSHAP